MVRTLFVLLAVVATCALGLTAGGAAAFDRVVAPVDAELIPVKPTRDLYVSGVSSSHVRITNGGRFATSSFTVRFSAGWVGDACHWTQPPAYVRVFGMGGLETRTIRVPSESSTARTVTLDIYNEVAESNELNNSATVPGSQIVC